MKLFFQVVGWIFIAVGGIGMVASMFFATLVTNVFATGLWQGMVLLALVEILGFLEAMFERGDETT